MSAPDRGGCTGDEQVEHCYDGADLPDRPPCFVPAVPSVFISSTGSALDDVSCEDDAPAE